MTFQRLVFEDRRFATDRTRPGLWLSCAVFLVLGYLIFGLTLQGVRELSRGGFLFAASGALWAAVGVATRQARFPPVLLLPLAFMLYTAVSGLQLDTYPVEDVLQLFTVWIGATAVAFFLANGVSLNVVLLGLVVLCAANFAAIAAGYDTHLLNVGDPDADPLWRQRALQHLRHPPLHVFQKLAAVVVRWLRQRHLAA